MYETNVLVHVKKRRIEDVSASSDSEFRSWFWKIWQEKDSLLEYCRKHGKFPGRNPLSDPLLSSSILGGTFPVLSASRRTPSRSGSSIRSLRR